MALLKAGRPREAWDVLSGAVAGHPDWPPAALRSLQYNAACAAALCAAGQGADTPPAAERPVFCRRALDHLTAVLARYRASAGTELAAVHEQMKHWLADPDLAAVREPTELDKIPPDERESWVKLWADVRALRGATAPPEKGPAPREAKP